METEKEIELTYKLASKCYGDLCFKIHEALSGVQSAAGILREVPAEYVKFIKLTGLINLISALESADYELGKSCVKMDDAYKSKLADLADRSAAERLEKSLRTVKERRTALDVAFWLDPQSIEFEEFLELLGSKDGKAHLKMVMLRYPLQELSEIFYEVDGFESLITFLRKRYGNES